MASSPSAANNHWHVPSSIQLKVVFRCQNSQTLLDEFSYSQPLPSVPLTFTLILPYIYCGPSSSVCIATGYGLDGPMIEFRWRGEIFRTCPDRPWAHPASCTLGTGSVPGIKSGRGVTLTPHPLSSADGHERVELYLYSHYGPYGVYRASVPVQGCTLLTLYHLLERLLSVQLSEDYFVCNDYFNLEILRKTSRYFTNRSSYISQRTLHFSQYVLNY
jgi:hypothetical protein